MFCFSFIPRNIIILAGSLGCWTALLLDFNADAISNQNKWSRRRADWVFGFKGCSLTPLPVSVDKLLLSRTWLLCSLKEPSSTDFKGFFSKVIPSINLHLWFHLQLLNEVVNLNKSHSFTAGFGGICYVSA